MIIPFSRRSSKRCYAAVGATDAGRCRENNEDALLILPEESIRDGEGGVASGSLRILVAVSDGMGGANAGEVASRICTESLADGWPPPNDSAMPDFLCTAFNHANRRILERSTMEKREAGMGATLTALALTPEGGFAAHVGDSRLYQWRKEKLTRLTRDHTHPGALLAAGRINEAEARCHPMRNVLTQAVGTERDTLAIDSFPVDSRPGDLYLLCSDGLSDGVDDAAIAMLLQTHDANWSALPGHLIDAANAAGGKDNITVLLLKVLP